MNYLSSLPARCVLAISSGATYAMAYPPLGWGWLVVPGIAGLLVSLRGLHGTRARTIGFLHGLVAFGVGLSWMIHIFGPLVIILWCILAAFTWLFAEMQSRAVLRGLVGWRLAGFTALNWCAWEFIRAEVFPLKFPWMTAGLAIGPNAFGTQLPEAPGGGWRNIALTLDPTGTLGLHNKVHTVHLFDDGKPGKTALPIQTSHGKIGTPVCFDCDYEGVTRRMTAAGVEMFIVPIMDAESWTARQHEQHGELFRIRACENGRWMFVCATSGVSQVIDPHGQVHARLPVLTGGSLIGKIHAVTQLTFYTRFGWLTPWIVLLAAAVWWLALLLPKRPKQLECKRINDPALDCAQPAAALVSQPAASKSIQITTASRLAVGKRQQAARSPSKTLPLL